MRPLHTIKTMATGLLLIATFSATAQNASVESLPEATQNEISRVCLPVQFREGARAYRNCVQAELNLQSSGNETELASLSFDDKYAVQQACAKAGGQSSASYQSCVSSQVTALGKVSKPALEKLSEDEQYVVQQSCFDAQSKQGAASYRQCLNGEVNSLLSIAAADTSDLDMLKKNALQLRCSSKSSNALQYRECVAAEFESIVGFAPSFLPIDGRATAPKPVQNVATKVTAAIAPKVVEQQTQVVARKESAAPKTSPIIAAANSTVAAVTAQPATEVEEATTTTKPRMGIPRNISPPKTEAIDTAATPNIVVAESQIPNALVETSTTPQASNVSNTATAKARVISRPKLVETLELQARAKAQGIELSTNPDAATPTTPTGVTQTPALLWESFMDVLRSLDRTGWLLIAGVLALPALLLGFFSLMRRARKPAAPVQHNAALTERIESGMRTRQAHHEQQAASLFEDEETSSDHDALTRLSSKPERTELHPPESNAAARPPFAETNDANRHTAAPLETSAANETFTSKPHSSDSAWQSAFGHWLMQQPDSGRMETCIEFLIYWVAYGDERYQPEMKTQLLAKTSLDSHDQVKRCVLKQDTYAFADVVGWLRTHATPQQLQQSTGLIMALLVTENSVTPVQNTMLRFLSDAFEIGKDQLESNFEEAFGHALPPIPRVDKSAWWAKQEPDVIERWDARSMTSKPEIEQMMARLGLPATFDETQVTQAFRRAARRCHPDRFTHLGDRERALAEQQFIKFEQARDKLLGVIV